VDLLLLPKVYFRQQWGGAKCAKLLNAQQLLLRVLPLLAGLFTSGLSYKTKKTVQPLVQRRTGFGEAAVPASTLFNAQIKPSKAASPTLKIKIARSRSQDKQNL
jgi:hypothetical protein